ncbi:DUF1599 domain-containing protein [Paraflavisolibacter sp. H34]|uniref:DUF1599 domain-containing protein n=1 Tax=Huijunlia imazamoxiresistens TaxID=3127457 RepID=UPI003018BC17
MQTVQSNTEQQYDRVVDQCRDIFFKKTRDYGTAWRVLRTISIADQLYIKAYRIRTIQETGHQKIGDSIASEFVGIVNYAVIGLIQLELPVDAPEELTPEDALHFYNKQIATARSLMQAKNHDYGEAWRQLSQESFVDLILMKLQRMRQIVANKGATLISEGLDANYLDMINYAVFAQILQSETHN